MIHSEYSYSWRAAREVFLLEFHVEFSKSPRYNAASVPNLLQLLDLIEKDSGISDIRWAAYMLATVMWETTVPTTILRQANRKGKPLVDKHGIPIMLKRKAWLMSMAPVSEVGRGRGRKYHEPVKVRVLASGDVVVTEQDGDQFQISSAGVISNLTPKAKMGTADGGDAERIYNDDSGSEQAYFGRGYVQLTWWSNYAKASVNLGRGLDFLLEPELVKKPENSYAVMSHGMRTGKGFANGHRFTEYFNHFTTDYIGARRMVNGTDQSGPIAEIAVVFERILKKAIQATSQRFTGDPMVVHQICSDRPSYTSQRFAGELEGRTPFGL